jgi:hypothetical protein
MALLSLNRANEPLLGKSIEFIRKPLTIPDLLCFSVCRNQDLIQRSFCCMLCSMTKMFTPDSTALCSHLLGGRLIPHRANQGRAVGDHRSADGFQARQAATKTWRRLKGENQLPKVITGVKFVNGVEWIEPKSQNAA